MSTFDRTDFVSPIPKLLHKKIETNMSDLTPSKRKQNDRSDTQVTLRELNLETYNIKISNVKFLP